MSIYAEYIYDVVIYLEWSGLQWNPRPPSVMPETPPLDQWAGCRWTPYLYSPYMCTVSAKYSGWSFHSFLSCTSGLARSLMALGSCCQISKGDGCHSHAPHTEKEVRHSATVTEVRTKSVDFLDGAKRSCLKKTQTIHFTTRVVTTSRIFL